MNSASNKATQGDILIVDDTPDNLRVLSSILSEQGYKVRKVINGQMALMVAQEASPDLILLDIMMPEMDGYEVCQKLKADEKTRQIPVIFISALDEGSDIVKGFTVGGLDYINKPFKSEVVLARVQNQLSLRRLQKQLAEQNTQLLEEIRDRIQAEEALRAEQERSQRLLLNILPHTIVEQLKQFQGSLAEQAEQFDDVTILFADIVGFTPLCARMRPVKLLLLLNEIFSAFDNLAEQHSLEKIKTIGDAYMVAGGLPTVRSDHAEAIAAMALDMQQEISQFQTDSGEPLSLRIGIHTGAVMAGVIGLKKYIYDLWGDTVNIASRMESMGEAGKIQVTAETYERLAGKYLFENRGAIDVKGKGKMTTYWLTERKLRHPCN